MSDRFFADQSITGECAVLEGPEAHHLLHVMRARPGDEVVLFDGSGAEFAARVEQIGRSSVELAVLSRTMVDRELSLTITLGASLPKGDRQRWLVEKLTELGVSRFVPLVTRRGVAQPLEAACERLQKTVIEACKQCGRNRLMKINMPHTIEQFLTDADQQALRLFAHPGGVNLVSEIRRLQNGEGKLTAVSIAIGPEGGFTDEELTAATAAGWQPVDLGLRLLRVETAALAMASAVSLLAQ